MLIVGRLAHGRRGPGLRLHQQLPVSRGRRHHRSRQPERKRSGPIPPHRAGRALSGSPRPVADRVFAWYTLTGALATAAGSLVAGLLTQTLEAASHDTARERTHLVLLYAAMGLLLALLFHRLSPPPKCIRIRPPLSRREPALAWGLHAPSCSSCLLSSRSMPSAAASSYRVSPPGGFIFASASTRPCWAASSSAQMCLPASPPCWHPGWQRDSGWSGPWCLPTSLPISSSCWSR